MARRVSSPVLIGRDEEVVRLSAALAEASAGQARTVLVGGEAGIGKTRLVAEAMAAAAAGRARVLTGGCIPVRDESLPYGAVVEALRRLFEGTPGAAPPPALCASRAELARLLPDLAPERSPAPPPRNGARRRLFELLLGLVRSLAAECPLVLVLEDLHWADRATLDLLAFLVHNLRDERVLLVATFRSDELEMGRPLRHAVAELVRLAAVDRLELHPLDRPAIARLVGAIIGHEPPADLVRAIDARAQGNPFFAEELLAVAPGAGHLPATLRDVLQARLGELSAATREAVRVVAVAGAAPARDVLAEVLCADGSVLARCLREAVDRGVLIPLDGPEERFEFRHALLREAAYGELLPGERSRLHAAYAEALERRLGQPPALAAAIEIAKHLAATDDVAAAITASARAARLADAASVFDEAAAQYERVLALWPRVPDAAARLATDLAAVLERAAEAHTLAGSPSLGVARLRAAIALVDPAREAVRAGLLQAALGGVLLRAGDDGGSLAAHREAVRLVPALDRTAARARVVEGLARHLVLGGRLGEGTPLAIEAVELARERGAVGAQLHGLVTLGVAEVAGGDVAAGLARLRDARDRAVAAGEVDAAGRAWTDLADFLEGEACLRESLAAARWETEHGQGRGIGLWTRCIASLALHELGRWDEADRLLEEVRLAGPEGEAVTFLAVATAQLDVGRGRLEAARARLAAVGPSLERDTLGDWRQLAGHLDAQLCLAEGRPEAARTLLAPLAATASEAPLDRSVRYCGLLATALRVEADLATESRRRRRRSAAREARERGATVLALAEAVAHRVELAGAAAYWRRPAAVRAVCIAEHRRLEGAASVAAWDAAARACLDAGQLHLRPYALIRQAEAVLAGGDADPARARHRSAADDRAAGLLARATEEAAEMGAEPLLERAAEIASRARLTTATATHVDHCPPDQLAAFRLTPREREVLDLVADGRSNREIGHALFVTERTAALHVSHVLAKLDVPSRTAAASLALRVGRRDPRARDVRIGDERGPSP